MCEGLFICILLSGTFESLSGYLKSSFLYCSLRVVSTVVAFFLLHRTDVHLKENAFPNSYFEDHSI